jgi:hypothetical protein
MKLPLLIRSHYFKGLLVLLRRDGKIDTRERELILRIGQIFDFDSRFCEAAIDELLSNAHISRKPIVFSDENIKDSFFRDALRLAFVDGNLHERELSWLRRVAHSNGRSDKWLNSIVQEIREGKSAHDPTAPFEIQQYL